MINREMPAKGKMAKKREIHSQVRGQRAVDGAGVHLVRVLGSVGVGVVVCPRHPLRADPMNMAAPATAADCTNVRRVSVA